MKVNHTGQIQEIITNFIPEFANRVDPDLITLSVEMGENEQPEKIIVIDPDRSHPLATFVAKDGKMERLFQDIDLSKINQHTPIQDGDYRVVGGKNETYQVRNGTWYSGEAFPDCIEILERYRKLGKFLRIDLGNLDGSSWSEEFPQCKIGRSTGIIKVPLALPNPEEHFGDAIPAHCIVSMMRLNGSDLWRHPNYTPKYDWKLSEILMNPNFDAVLAHQEPAFKVHAVNVKTQENEYIAGFESLREAEDWVKDKKKFEPAPRPAMEVKSDSDMVGPT